ncbi:MAG: FAD-dependent oxidoreductase [Planctomycetota bacterium]
MNDAPREVDVAVIGGGIHGAGVLQAAVAAGHSALLLEAQALASGTSSRSSKLIHGGLRYLENAQLGLVRESLAERATLARVAQGLVKLVPFYLPIYRETTRRPWQIRAGLSLYAALGDLAREARFTKVPKRAWGDLDGLRTDGLQAVFRYFDGQTDDAALVRAVARSAQSLGAHVECPAELVSAQRHAPNAASAFDGYVLHYKAGEREHECRARIVVNAAGPWANRVRERMTPLPPGMTIDLVAGTHIELTGSLTAGIYYAEAPSDRRAVFLMPWKGHTLVGTTETPFTGDPRAVKPLAREIEYLQETLRHYLPQHEGTLIDAWAGLRVLPSGEGSAFLRRRDTTLVCDDEKTPRMVAIYGGKLTGYRATAEKVIERVKSELPARASRGSTKEIVLPLPE